MECIILVVLHPTDEGLLVKDLRILPRIGECLLSVENQGLCIAHLGKKIVCVLLGVILKGLGKGTDGLWIAKGDVIGLLDIDCGERRPLVNNEVMKLHVAPDCGRSLSGGDIEHGVSGL